MRNYIILELNEYKIIKLQFARNVALSPIIYSIPKGS